MSRSIRWKIRLRQILTIAIIWTLAGGVTAVYDHVTSATAGLERTESYSFAINFFSGALGGLFSSFTALPLMLFVLRPRLRRFPFIISLLLNTLVIIVLIYVIFIIVVFIIFSGTYDLPFWHPSILKEVWESLVSAQLIKIIMIWLVITAATFFMVEVNDKYGQGVLKDILLGRYHRPKQQSRIFMFLDIKSSTTIAERLGDIKYFDFLNEFFKDVTDPIVDSMGKIYQYVGDEIVVYWDLKEGRQNNNCVRCFFAIEERIKKHSEKYEQKFGFVPEFKAGYHYGQVTIGEIGVIKKDIVSSGDVLNTAARIQSQCNQYQAKVLVSKDMVDLLNLDSDYHQELIGEIQLRGKQKEVALFRIAPRIKMNNAKKI